MLDDGGEALNPVTRVQVVDSADLLVLRRVDVAADDAVTLLMAGEFLEQLLVTVHKANSGFHPGLHPLAEGEILLATPRPPEVVGAVHLEQIIVADGTEQGDPAMIGGDAVEAVAMDDEVARPFLHNMDVLLA